MDIRGSTGWINGWVITAFIAYYLRKINREGINMKTIKDLPFYQTLSILEAEFKSMDTFNLSYNFRFVEGKIKALNDVLKLIDEIASEEVWAGKRDEFVEELKARING